VPLCLLLIIAVMFDISFFINELLITLDWLFEKLITFMQAFQSVEFSTIKAMQFGYVQLCLAVVLLVFVFLPNWPNRKRIIVMLGASIALHAFTQIKFGSGFNNSAQNSNQHTQNKWSLRVFDIGQGLSVLIRQGNEFLVYDTGMAFANGGSMAANVIKPYFAANKQSAMQVTAIEYLVNSHMDNDHAGGNGFMFSHYDVKTWLSPAKGCTVKDSFVWGSLNFTVLWPLDNRTGDDNNDSCVIKVSDGEHSVLLTGDIEKEVEKELVKQHLGTNALKSDIMLAPHHGSSTSSTLPFVRAVSPKIIVISSQYYNQYRFPQSNVLRHYQDVEAEIFNTAYDGEVSFEFSRRGIHANAYRQHWLSPWYMQIQ
jgi:competence protein ComEC